MGCRSGRCNHVGGPLGQGSLQDDYVTCPWHYWKFHWQTGAGEPGYEADRVPSYAIRVEGGRIQVRRAAADAARPPAPSPASGGTQAGEGGGAHPRARFVDDFDDAQPAPLQHFRRPARSTRCDHAETSLGCDSRLLRLRDLRVRECEGFYSKSAHACTWPCSITQMDATDEMVQVYEGVVHWADVILVATPIRWGAPASQYFKMVERMNCIQNQETLHGRHLLKNKVAAFIITGGQDNVQAVAGQMLMFFGEVGCQFPQFPFIAHSRGWSAEDMERNQEIVRASAALHEGAAALVARSVDMARTMIASTLGESAFVRGGRKAQGGRAGEHGDSGQP